MTWVHALAILLITVTYLYVWTRPRLHVQHDPVLDVVTIRRVGSRIHRSYAGHVGDILIDREASGAVVGITMTEMHRYYDNPSAFDKHRDRAIFPRYLWRALRRWIVEQSKSATWPEDVLAARRERERAPIARTWRPAVDNPLSNCRGN